MKPHRFVLLADLLGIGMIGRCFFPVLQHHGTSTGPVFPRVPGFSKRLDGSWIYFAKIPFNSTGEFIFS